MEIGQRLKWRANCHSLGSLSAKKGRGACVKIHKHSKIILFTSHIYKCVRFNGKISDHGSKSISDKWKMHSTTVAQMKTIPLKKPSEGCTEEI